MMENSFKRAQRRHDAARIKKNRRWHWGRDMAQEGRQLGKLLHTATPCSCPMCGNPRKYFGHRTIQELRALQEPADLD